MDTNSLVARVCPQRSDFEAVRERVRHWCREELFVLGAKPVGRGRSRDFAPRCVLEAALLNELANLGIPVVRWGMTNALLEMAFAGEAWAAGDRQPRWLQIVFMPVSSPRKLGKIAVFPHVGRLKPIHPPGTATMVIIDVTSILKRVRWSQADEGAVPLRSF